MKIDKQINYSTVGSCPLHQCKNCARVLKDEEQIINAVIERLPKTREHALICPMNHASVICDCGAEGAQLYKVDVIKAIKGEA